MTLPRFRLRTQIVTVAVVIHLIRGYERAEKTAYARGLAASHERAERGAANDLSRAGLAV
jgi:hypothetical protein